MGNLFGTPKIWFFILIISVAGAGLIELMALQNRAEGRRIDAEYAAIATPEAAIAECRDWLERPEPSNFTALSTHPLAEGIFGHEVIFRS